MHTTSPIVDRPERLPEHPRAALTDDTLVQLTAEGDGTWTTPLGQLFADNIDDPDFDRAGIFAALSKGEVYRGGGGATPEWSVEIAS